MTHFKPKPRQNHFTPITASIAGLSSVNKTVNRLLTELVEHHRGKTRIPDGNALNAVAQNLPWLPTDSIVLFLAKPHSPWVEHVVVLDPRTKETILDQNPYLKISWDRNDRYEALMPGGRVSTFVPLREITVDEIIRQGGLHYEIKKLQVNMKNKQRDMEQVREHNKEIEQRRLQHFWPMKQKDDPRVKQMLPKEGIIPRLTPVPDEDEEAPPEQQEEHFSPVPEQVDAPEQVEEQPLDDETVRKMNRLKELDDIVEKEEEVERIKDEIVQERENEQQEDDEQPEGDNDEEPEDGENEDEETEGDEETEDDETEDGDDDNEENEDDSEGDDQSEDEEQPKDDENEDEETEGDEEQVEDDDSDTEQEKELKETDDEQEETDEGEQEDEEEQNDGNEEETDEGEQEDDTSDDNEVKLQFKSIKDMSDQELEGYFRHLIEMDDKGKEEIETEDEETNDEETEDDEVEKQPEDDTG